MKIKSVFFVLLLLVSMTMYSQNIVNKSLKIGAGLGLSQSDNCTGMGTLYSFGYQRDIWKDRLRFNPNLSLGFYSPVFITDWPKDIKAFYMVLKSEDGEIITYPNNLIMQKGVSVIYRTNIEKEFFD